MESKGAAGGVGRGEAGVRTGALLGIVFVAGAVLMGLEIAGSRVLAPYFGNSVYVWGSLITVFLMALSLGYYVGGRVADRHPSYGVLTLICAVVSVMIFVVPFVAPGLCTRLVDAGWGEQSGPLLASLVMFLPPSVGMGMVSPYAIRLAASSISSVGKIAGTLYAISTAGSILGTLVTTFVLIPNCSLSSILKGLGIALLAGALLTIPAWRSRRTGASLLLLAALLLTGMVFREPLPPPINAEDELLVRADTPYHSIKVYNNRLFRLLCFDKLVEGAVRNEPPHRPVGEFTNYFHLAFLLAPQIERTLFIGAGVGLGPRSFHTHSPQMKIDLVDIDPKVLELTFSHFFLEPGPHLNVVADDGRIFLRRATASYDCIVLDAFSAGGRIPFHLVTREFLELCRARMSARGVFVMNINSAIEGPRSGIFHAMHQTCAAVFPQVYVFALPHPTGDPRESRNVILIASMDTQRLTDDQWLVRAARHQSASYVGSAQMVKMVGNLLTKLPDMSAAQVFTDDFAPIETMAF
ncbi:MAG: fused MFS/spermidine synthase [Pirellulales bacterium]